MARSKFTFVLMAVFIVSCNAQKDRRPASSTEPGNLPPLTLTYDPANVTDAVEFYHTGMDHYFMTSEAAEIAQLDSGAIPGWKRTGHKFPVFFAGATVFGSNPVCRFYGKPEAGLKSSHFYSASPGECLAVYNNFPGWQLESWEVFRAFLPDTTTGACPSDTRPVFRLLNSKEPNHRYTTDPGVFEQMKARGYIPEGYGNPNFPVVMCAPSYTAPRPILGFLKSAQVGPFVVDHKSKPLDIFYINPRYQTPTPTDPLSSPIRYLIEYNAVSNTGLAFSSAIQQRGILGGNQEQSLFQIGRETAGVLMRSWDSPHPSTIPVCQPNCSGYQKHTVYEYRFSSPQQIFSTQDGSRALEITADIKLPQFESWNIYGGPPRGLLAGQLAFVIFLEDPDGKPVQYVVFVYDSLPTNDGAETLSVEVIGAGNNGYFVVSSVKKGRPMDLVSVDPGNVGDFEHATWAESRTYKIRITPHNIVNAANALNAKGGTLSTNPYAYKLRQVGLNQEVFYENNGDAWVMGSSFANITAREF